MISTSLIPKFYSDIFNFFDYVLHANEYIFKSKYYLIFTLNFGLCEKGEIYITSLKMYKLF